MLIIIIVLFTDLTITTDRLKELFESLVDPKKIGELGEMLSLPQSQRDNIQKSYHSPSQRKEAYLDLYVHHHPCPRWNLIARLLRYPCDLRQQANFVEDTYVKGTLWISIVSLQCDLNTF